MRRFIATLVAVTAATLGALTLASPAQADPLLEHYAIMTKAGPTNDHSFYIDEEYRIIGCYKCYVVFLYWPVVQEEHPDWQGELMEGLDWLSEASVAEDERTAAALQARALESFTGAARALDGATMK